jgi:4'-phosphopantetheinyl transferase
MVLRRETDYFCQGEDVELWLADLDAASDQIDEWKHALLSTDERERAARYFQVCAGRRFIAARAILRLLLGERLGIAPRAIVFAQGTHGKPKLAGAGSGKMHFNVSHSSNWALFGFSVGGMLGVDLEQVREVPEWEEIARHSFPQQELSRLAQLSPQERHREFIRSWTRHEAVLKAFGWGLAGPSASRRVQAMPGLALREISAPPGYAAALAHRAGRARVIERTWNAPAHG